jgi:sulfur carrier protein ThiS
MTLTLKLFASLRKYLPPQVSGGAFSVEVPEGSTVADVLAHVGIPRQHARMVVADGEQLDLDAPVCEGQGLSVFPPLAGGR